MRNDVPTIHARFQAARAPILQRASDRYPRLIALLTSRLLVSCVMLAASLCVIVPCSYREPNVYDEGIQLYGAVRIMAGELPYRDLWTIYPPGALYLLAGLFKLFGVQLIVERHAWVLLKAIIALLVFAIARRLTRSLWAVLCWGVTVIWLTRLPLFGTAMSPALVCCFGAVLATLLFLDDARRAAWAWPVAAAGVLTGVCTLFRQDIGAYTFLAIAATLVVARVWPARATPDASAERARASAATAGRHALHPLLLFVAATALPLVPAALALLAWIPASRLVEHLVTFPFVIYPETRSLSLPAWPASPVGVLSGDVTAFTYLKDNVRSWQLYLSAGVLLAAWSWTLFAIVRGRRTAGPWPARATFLVSSAGLLMLNYARIRSDIYHLYPAFIFALIVGAGLMSGTSRWRARWPRVALTSLALAGMAGVLLLTWRTEQKIWQRQSPFETALAAGMSTPHASHAYERLIAYVQQVVPPDEPIFVGNRRHDEIGSSDALIYFLSARRSATRYHDLHPGVVTTDRVQREIIADLERQHVTCVVLRDEEAMGTLGPDRTSWGATTLDRYIASNFVAGPSFEEYQVWERPSIVRQAGVMLGAPPGAAAPAAGFSPSAGAGTSAPR